MTDDANAERLHWYQGVPRYAWMVLVVCALGWLFDTMDQHLFTLVRQPSVKELMAANGVTGSSLDAAAKEVGAQITAVFLLGWAFGGAVFGIVGDRLGRTRTMMLTILTYAAFTGLNALVHAPWQYAVCRFLTAMGVGGEFAAGAALVAEVWPERSRPMALGLLQALSAVGNMSAAVITLVLSAYSWRYVFLVGAVPALLVIWVYAGIREPDRWQRAHDEAAKDRARKELGAIANLFSDPLLRRNTIAGVLLATAGVAGAWGVGFFLADLVGSALAPLVKALPSVAALSGGEQAKTVNAILAAYRSKVFFVQQVGAFIGMFGYAAVSQRIGRKSAMAIVFVGAFLAVEATFWLLRDPLSAYLLAFPLGVFALAPFSAYAVYFPELFPTRLRATGIGFCYNVARVVAAAAPFVLGKLSTYFSSPTDETAGLRTAAAIVACVYFVGLLGLVWAPETRGEPLPD